jgi:hypothetical protein
MAVSIVGLLSILSGFIVHLVCCEEVQQHVKEENEIHRKIVLIDFIVSSHVERDQAEHHEYISTVNEIDA